MKKKKRIVAWSASLLLLPLVTFKYLNFLSAQLEAMISTFHIVSFHLPDLFMPIGISFFSFQALGYVIDVYRGDAKPQSLYKTTLFISFFPQLSAGPIGRAPQLLPQFEQRNKCMSYDQFITGVSKILIGWFKKAFIADRLIVYVGNVYGNIELHSGLSLSLASIFFALQLYCDFSGYSDMAVGSAKLLGFRLTENFRQPYLATSVRFFWSRWHVSLTSWFRDYLYVPIYKSWLGDRKKLSMTVSGILTIFVFAVSGMWHGAGWTFIVWGLLNGLFLAVEPPLLKRWFTVESKVKNRVFQSFLYVAKILITFTMMTFCFIFFRAENLHDAFLILKKILFHFTEGIYIGDTAIFFYSVLSVLAIFALDIHMERGGNPVILRGKNLFVTALRISSIIVIILLFGVLDQSQFIYFQF